MGRVKPADALGAIYHMLNRANHKATIFAKDADYEAFERILDDAVAKFEIELFSYCVMSRPQATQYSSTPLATDCNAREPSLTGQTCLPTQV